jgi:hypothetical protein
LRKRRNVLPVRENSTIHGFRVKPLKKNEAVADV